MISPPLFSENLQVHTWMKVFRIIPEFRILRLSIESQPQNAELGSI